jgi:hypothetical protein
VGMDAPGLEDPERARPLVVEFQVTIGTPIMSQRAIETFSLMNVKTAGSTTGFGPAQD